MQSPIADCLNALRLGAPIVHGRLAMYPLLAEHDRAPDYLTLDEAMDQGCCEVRELTEGGHVNRLVLVNRADRPVLLLDGELLVGAKQNRVLNLTLLAPARADTELPVSCVEQGRWSYTGERRFHAAKQACYARARAVKAAQVTANKRRHQTSDADQVAVWDEIRAKSARMAAHSPTLDVACLFRDREDELEHQVTAFAPVAHQTGALFALDGHILGLDLFDSPRTLARVLPRLARGYALEAFDPLPAGQPTGATPVADFLDGLKAAQPSYHRAPGLGEDVRVEADGLGASALLHAGRLVHLFAYASPPPFHEQDG